MNPTGRRPSILFVAGLAWMTAVAAGFCLLQGYAATPGRSAIRPPSWPDESGVVADPDRANLVMLVHPRCPCTWASLAELGKIMALRRPQLSAHVLFIEPLAPTPAWKDTELWRRAAAIPGTRSISDPGGVEAGRFGARTSGHALLFDRSGKLLFSGGITGARGHEGDNAGSAAVIALAAGRPDRARTDTFGCPLFSATDWPGRERAACLR